MRLSDRSGRSSLSVLAVGSALVLAACSGTQGGSQDSSAASSPAAVPSAKANAANQACAPFPATDIPPDPTPPYSPPYGDPQQPASLTALQSAVATAAQQPEYSKTATMCAEGMTQVQACDVDYWNVGGLPGKEEDCNFFYMRVVDEYWKGLTPLVLSQYTGYLGVTADGKDPANQNAGPHTTIAEYNGSWVSVGPRGSAAAQFTPKSGVLDAADLATALTGTLGKAVTSSSLGPDLISPVIAGDQLAADCSTVWLSAGGQWQQTTVAAIPVKVGTVFACAATGPAGTGTAYVEATLQAPTGSTVPAAVSVKVPSDKSNTLRKDPNGSFDAANVVWPTGTSQVSQGTAVPFTIPTGDGCAASTGPGNGPCLHLWVNFPSKPGESNAPALVSSTDDAQAPAVGSEAALAAPASAALACTIWFTLELKSPDLLSTMTGYGLSTDGYTPHISLAKRKWQASEVGPPSGTAAGKPDPCTDAKNLAAGTSGVTPFNPNP